MSLDVYLEVDVTVQRQGSGIFIREDGEMREITRDEWDDRNPGHEPSVRTHVVERADVFEANITHNLGQMASAAGIYEHLWRPEEIGIQAASQLIEPLRAGMEWLRANPEDAQKHNPSNGWGTYGGLMRFVEKYMQACEDYPTARVGVSR